MSIVGSAPAQGEIRKRYLRDFDLLTYLPTNEEVDYRPVHSFVVNNNDTNAAYGNRSVFYVPEYDLNLKSYEWIAPTAYGFSPESANPLFENSVLQGDYEAGVYKTLEVVTSTNTTTSSTSTQGKGYGRLVEFRGTLGEESSNNVVIRENPSFDDLDHAVHMVRLGDLPDSVEDGDTFYEFYQNKYNPTGRRNQFSYIADWFEYPANSYTSGTTDTLTIDVRLKNTSMIFLQIDRPMIINSNGRNNYYEVTTNFGERRILTRETPTAMFERDPTSDFPTLFTIKRVVEVSSSNPYDPQFTNEGFHFIGYS